MNTRQSNFVTVIKALIEPIECKNTALMRLADLFYLRANNLDPLDFDCLYAIGYVCSALKST